MAIETKTAETTTTAAEVKTVTETPAAAAASAKVETKAAEATPDAAKVDGKVVTAPQAEKPVVPEKYELKLSKDSLLDPAYVEKIATEAKADGLSNTQAQARLARDEQVAQQAFAQQQATFKQRADQWATDAGKDSEIGGEKFKENTELAKRAFDRVASPEMKKMMDETGFGNHPEVIRTFMRLGKMMADDKLVTEGKAGATAKVKKSTEEHLYPNMKPKT